MTVDFDADVLGPCFETFGVAAPWRRGGAMLGTLTVIGTLRPVLDEAQGVPSLSMERTLGVRLAGLPSRPVAGDIVEVSGQGWQIAEVRDDGQGKADLVVKVAS
ncbi:head-tail joining protein [Zavarzinia sp.]|uniref:head-tail joining protein n=1 Tax=Zavarzinia sp. TaxID=2027920 RepID=UPI003BB5B344